ncbi:MAG: hypothetical protein ACOYVD_15225 [Bacillota bacterium]
MPKIDKEQLGKQLAEIEKMMQNLPLQGINMGNVQPNPMIPHKSNIELQQIQRILHDIYITVHENQRTIYEIKHRLELVEKFKTV